MTTAENTIKALIQALDKHTTNYNLTEDTEGIYTLEATYSERGYSVGTLKFKLEDSRIIELDDDEEPTGYTYNVDGFVAYIFS
ncbi:hypothetical protein RND61_14705 [Streptomyces sp. TRM76323]|uniref:Uncharacterized protein n=1 Tax=Streptomyces tamarix TaxID=3078565 RepID=A0ABU3QKL9_9ACTN|nr:hypothetical protein [Streptomyces tamarix]MDT9683313.1 hypothetical protein [Streptomyces tamarix]